MRKLANTTIITTTTLLLLFTITAAKTSFLILTEDDLAPSEDEEDSPSLSDEPTDSISSFDGSEPQPYRAFDSGSWRPILEPDLEPDYPSSNLTLNAYYSAVRNVIDAAGSGDRGVMEEALAEMEALANDGDVYAQSVLGFVYGVGIGRERNKGKGLLYHHFAAEGGSVHSKMALAYTYYTQEMYDKAAKLYSELAEIAINSFQISKDAPPVELVRIHSGSAENTEVIRKYQGEEDEDFQILEYQAQKGNGGAMHKMGTYYYYGVRGVKRDQVKALVWVLKAAQKGEPKSMELLGEMYVRGAGVKRNYTDAFTWLKHAANRKLYSAYNGMGYMYVKGYGVEEKNYTRAKEYFEAAALAKEVGGLYNLGVMYLKGIGVKRNVKSAFKYFEQASQVGQPKALYQLAKMFHTGVGLKKNLAMATELYKLVAEQGPWSSLSRWALDSYLKGDVGKALLLYSRMAELGYEVAQSNAAWILDKYGENSMCMGESGLCTDAERYQRAHSLWWQASEQNNEHAALMIGDAYYYGWGTEINYASAAEAYMRAKSQSNAQALFNLGYMHEHGQGLPLDLHLAKRYYDQALQIDSQAKLPVILALASLWVRKNYANSFLVDVIDSLPQVFPRVEEWVENVLKEEGNATILTLFVCLLTVLYFRERHRRQAAPVARGPAPPLQFNDNLAPLAH